MENNKEYQEHLEKVKENGKNQIQEGDNYGK